MIVALHINHSSLRRWHQQFGEAELQHFPHARSAVAYRTVALATQNLKREAVDIPVQRRNVTFPTDPRPLHKANFILSTHLHPVDQASAITYLSTAVRDPGTRLANTALDRTDQIARPKALSIHFERVYYTFPLVRS